MSVRQILLANGINVFGADLLAESFLKSQFAQFVHDKGEPLKFFLSIDREDCSPWVGVEITIKPINEIENKND